MKEFTELIGQTYGELTIIKRDSDFITQKGKRYIMFLCKCSCGETCSKRKDDVLSGKTKSCGHLRKITSSLTGKNNVKRNIYDLTGDYGIGYTSKGEKFLFDLEDYGLIKDYCWCIHNGYVQSTNENRIISFHRVVMGVDDISFNEIIVDHIKTEMKNDNRKNNLRIGTQSNNNMNKKLQSNNTSGVKGVYWHNTIQKWVVNIVVDKKVIYLGTFDRKEFDKAVSVRKKAEKKYFGEWNYSENNEQDDQQIAVYAH